jgi:hypothetical protein
MTALLFFIFALGYAVLRYVVFGPVAAEHIPLYVANKAMAFTALSTLSAALLTSTLRERVNAAREGGPLDPVRLGVLGTWLALSHGAVSMLTLTRAYHPKLFHEDGTLVSLAEASMIAAVPIAVALVLGWARMSRAWRFAVVVLGVAHATLLGSPTWFRPSSWHGALPPITLLSVVLASTLLLAAVLTRRR